MKLTSRAKFQAGRRPNLTETNNMDEIIISDKGNTYIGNIAQNAIKTPIPPIFKIDGTENYHVFEWQYGRWILRASQSAMALALKYRGPAHVVVHRDVPTNHPDAPHGSVETVPTHALERRAFRCPNGSRFVELVDSSEAKWERYCKELAGA